MSPEEYLKLPKLGKDDTFTFGCNRCGSCCRERDDILLRPLDLFKIAKYLNKSIQEVVTEYCESYEGADSKMPIVRIKPRAWRGTCPFAGKEGCAIHPVKPSVCALFPLGRMTNYETKEFTYFIQPITCGNKKQSQTIREWLGDFSMLDEEEFAMLWQLKVLEISQILIDIYDRHTFGHEPVFATVLMNLYILYDLEKEFMPQFIKRSEGVINAMKQLTTELSKETGGVAYA